MPELPDLTVYVEGLEQSASGATLRSVRVLNAFLLRTALPALFEMTVHGRFGQPCPVCAAPEYQGQSTTRNSMRRSSASR